MNTKTSRAKDPVAMEALDPALTQALGDFKASVRAWSDAAYSRPRTVGQTVAHRSWRLAAGWSFAALLFAGTFSGGLYEHHQRVIAAQVAAQRAAEQAAQRAKEEAQKEEETLASIDSAVSREVPSAMEPLAQLSEENTSQ